ncbi:ATP-dependent RNA helicase RhlE [Myxococcus fulvus]|uniref:ATP-dependent RNA helicase RhlE n=1 Tax=Myxococcus fulvus TaxID=33 RepID=A0A511T7J3_MYXFU|nr:DEAD/DEAH box helicase [Myxococcus fulvus]GEN10136.1 ATP-dependent RNA helicase RhlE [Myxococcus fulvus]SEU35404.1 ATP-dependent RNA helicase RhlE [Myxococcus fulvus]
MSDSFERLGLSPETLGALRRVRFTQPTPIQVQAIPPALAGKDVIGCAATGTGKTAAYVLPLVERFAGRKGSLGLVLAPTRELVRQIAEPLGVFAEARGLTHTVVIGGEDMSAQVEALKAHPTFVLATPGRLVDLLESGSVSLYRMEGLVLDEADRMLDMGFLPQLERILAELPRKRQTLLFSATLGPDVGRFARERLYKPVRVEVTRSGTPAERAEQRLYIVKPEEKSALLLTLLAESDSTALVFAKSKERADKVLRLLQREGHKSAVLHADRTQNQRRQALEGFREGTYRCLVATDIAARGLDVEDVGQVINYDLPHSPEDYVHRIGRTARAQASGVASTFATSRDKHVVAEIERIMRGQIPRVPVPREDPVFQEAWTRFLASQKDPGPAQKDSGAAPGKAQGRHARTHGKRRPR